MIELLIFIPLSFTVPTLFMWEQFRRAGRKSWETLVPFYNLYIFLKIIKKTRWYWYVLLLFPFINVFMYMLMLVEMAKCFGKFSLGELFLAVVFPFIYFPYLATHPEDKYLDPATRVEPPKSASREWTDAIIFAVVAAMIIRTFLIELYNIPTSSMEKSLLVGDYLFVSKIDYGPRIPNTILSIPFVHNTIPLTKISSYLDWIELPYFRLPGLGKVHRDDPVVFNYPAGDTVATAFESNASYYSLVRQYGRKMVWSDKQDFGKIIYRPVDKEEDFVKRCIGLPGDSLQIINRKVYINGKLNVDPGKKEFEYYVITNGEPINPLILRKLNVTEGYNTNVPGRFVYYLTDAARDYIAKLPIVKKVVVFNTPAGVADPQLFPHDTIDYKWNRDNYGPIYIPKKGATIALNLKNLHIYRRVISVYEHNKLQVKDGKIFINGKQTPHYTFKMDYYWMMGDNRDNSADSRYWGFVPEDHIVGKPVLIMWSLDKNRSWLDGKLRWNRLFKLVK